VILSPTLNLTLPMPEPVIADTSVLILLQNIEELDLLLKVYGNINVTPEVAKEFLHPLPAWISIQKAQDVKYQEFLEIQLDPGEASAIALAKEHNDALLLLDDLKARKVAKKLNIRFTGTLGILYKAKETGIIPAIRPLTDKLVRNNFRISEKVLNKFLRLNNEYQTPSTK